jgi:NAD(P)-dependent dehydrogenase (short-subunit alcohol dehydrogenase family)
MAEFDNRVVMVTGAFGNLGRAVVRAFVAEGARVAMLDVGTRAPGPTEFGPGAQVLALGGIELSDPQRTSAAIGEAIKAFGRLDVLVNIAGGFRWETVEGGSVTTWDAMYAMNLKTAVVTSGAALPHLLASAPGSRIINIGAGAAARSAAAGMGAYTASKAGVQKLTESLADELRSRGVTVNAILPGTIDTPQNRADMPDADRSRWVQPASIAQVILFLASAKAADISGAAIPVG